MRVLLILVAGTAMAAPTVKWGNIPLSFEPNTGQEPAQVRYLARGSSYTLYLTSGETVLAGRGQSPLRMKLSGANPSARILGEAQQPSTSNYFVGNDPSKWHASVPNFGRVRYVGVYPGIDLVYYGQDGSLEYDWIVSPGADPQKIRMIFEGTDRLRIDKQGDLVISGDKNEYRHKKPLIYQEVSGKRIPVAGMWTLHGNESSFRIGTYDREKELVIDPPLIYSTYLGGNGQDWGYAIAVDKAGNTYVAGGTGSANFPTAGPLQSSLRGAEDVFVTKINSTGTVKLYSTYLGGGGPDEGKGIAVDSDGNAYVTGSAGSFDFPTMNAIQGTWGGSGDAFLTKLNPAGSALVYSTYLGGNGIDSGSAVAVDAAGGAYVVGITFSTNFPTINPFQAVKGAQQDAFVAKINPGGTAWVYATYLGGNNVDEGYGIAVDTTGNAYVTGYTASTNFPVQSAFRSSNAGGVDAFVTKINAAGSALVYSTYLGGTGTDYGTALAVDSSGSAYVTGITASGDFPLANPIDSTLGSLAVDDAFVAKLNPAGSALVYSTYLGGGSTDDAYALAIDQVGNAYITGRTNSSDFPLVNPIQATRFAFDMFVTEINPAGSAILFSTFIGGSGSESGRGIAVDRLGNIHIAGEGTSTDFPVVKPLQGTNGGGASPQDAFVLLLGNTPPVPAVSDFDSNGVPDLVWMNNTTRQVNVNYFGGPGGASLIGWNYLYQPGAPGWHVAAVADFDRNGIPDLVWQNDTTGQVNVNYYGGSGGATLLGYNVLFSSSASGWHVVGAGDFDNNGTPDLVWQNASTGQVNVTYFGGAGGASLTGFAVLYSPGAAPGWRIAAVADFNGDGVPDILWQETTTGQVNVNYFGGNAGASVTGFNVLYDPDAAPGWHVVGALDMDNNGTADVLWQNDSSGQVNINYFGGTTLMGFNVLYSAGSATGWTLIN